MDLDRVKTLKLSRPFRPFFLVASEGRRFLIEHAHHVALAPDGTRLGVVTKKGVSFLNPNEVKDVDILPAPLKKKQA